MHTLERTTAKRFATQPPHGHCGKHDTYGSVLPTSISTLYLIMGVTMQH